MVWQKQLVLLLLSLFSLSSTPQSFTNAAPARKMIHPGLLHNEADLQRMKDKVAAGAEPWTSGWKVLTANHHSVLNYEPQPVAIVYRGTDSPGQENYNLLYNDMAAAYALALRWHISGDKLYADKAIDILNAWSSTLKEVSGTADRYLAVGIYGYQMANAGELMYEYPGWTAADLKRLQDLMVNEFYAMNHRFLVEHNNAKYADHYYANWDLANMASMLAIGVFADRPDIYAEAVEYFKNGQGNGAITKAVWILYDDPTSEGLGQLQESGRDQGHTLLDISLLGTFCQMAWNQGDDLFGYDNNRMLKGAEYAARSNLRQPVPYTPYKNSWVFQPIIATNGTGTMRPIWELLYNHYVVLKGLKAPSVTEFAKLVRPEGGGGNYGPNSGGFDSLGYGTLTYTLEESPLPNNGEF